VRVARAVRVGGVSGGRRLDALGPARSYVGARGRTLLRQVVP